MISISIQNGSAFVWTASDWLKIREEHRIIGNLTGCLPGIPRQETFLGLPLKLLPEEVTLLLEKNFANVVNDSVLLTPPDENSKEKYISYKEENRKEQLAYFETQRKEQVTAMIDRIIEGKKRKLLGLNTKNKKTKTEDVNTNEEAQPDVEFDREEILKNELENISPPTLVQTFTSECWCDDTADRKFEWKFPESEQDKLKYCVFKDLWEKGYYITEGHKFGVDYLVYPGDPVKFHALFLVICVGHNDVVLPADIIAYGRLGSTTRKTFVIASKLNDEILYQSLQWTEKN